MKNKLTIGKDIRITVSDGFIGSIVAGWWEDAGGCGPIVQIPNGKQICVDLSLALKLIDGVTEEGEPK